MNLVTDTCGGTMLAALTFQPPHGSQYIYDLRMTMCPVVYWLLNVNMH